MTYLLVHLLTEAQQHQHVVALRDAHGVEVAEDVRTRNPSLEKQDQLPLKIHNSYTVKNYERGSFSFQKSQPRFVGIIWDILAF